MSVSGISSSNLYNYSAQNLQTQINQVQQDFKQLGQDLQSGNLSAAQSDFTTLQKIKPQSSSTSASQSSSPLAQAFQKLGQDLQSGNLSGAQQDYSSIQQDFQNLATQMQGHHHHHHGGGETSTSGSSTSGTSAGAIGQMFSQLGQSLQSGNLSSAQSEFASLQQELQAFIQTGSQSSTQTGSPGISISA
jgi:outer membrane protein assembly factor BamD (BamD/ComL family)